MIYKNTDNSNLINQSDHILFAPFQLSSQLHIILLHSSAPQFHAG